MKDHEKYRIDEIATDGEPIAPEDVKTKFIKQCRVVVREYVPITFQEWNKTNRPGGSFVGPVGKDNLWKRLKVNFILPEPEVESDVEDPEQELEIRKNIIEEKVKKFALMKMAQQFCNWKKRLYNEFVKKDKTPDFSLKMCMKLKDDWEAFKAYKLSEEALQKSEKNAANAKKKKFHHTMGPGGYSQGMPKWAQLEADMLAQGITPEPYTWETRVRNWFYGHGGKLDSEGNYIHNIRHKENPLPIKSIRNAVKDVEEGRIIPDREKDELTCALGNKEHKGEHEAHQAPSRG